MGSDAKSSVVLPFSTDIKYAGNSFVTTSLIAIIVAAAILGFLVLGAAFFTGSIGAGIAYLSGDPIYIYPRNLIVSGKSSEVQVVTLTNLSREPIRVLGYNAVCSCVTISELPIELGPRETKRLSVQADSATSKEVPVMFLTDRPNQGLVGITVKVIATGATS